MDDYEKVLLYKLDMNIPLTTEELRVLVFELDVETKYGDNRRWTRTVTTISKIGNRYFKTVWEQGLTECQENEFYRQPVEVEKYTYEKNITVTEWRVVSNNG